MLKSEFGRMQFRTADGVQYISNRWGGISQANPLPFVYNDEYNATYDTEAYKEAEKRLMAIRMALVLSYCAQPESLLDFGYGNGSFLDKASEHVLACSGYDIANTDYHKGKRWERVKDYKGHRPEVATFWDSLEHTYDPLNVLKDIAPRWAFISLPWAHLGQWEVEQFEGWKHRKPDEHIHHFDEEALAKFAKEAGYVVKWVGNIEDEIRTPARQEKNILTAVLKFEISV